MEVATDSTKQCFKCKEALPISEFYEHPMMADGRLGKCKKCAMADTRENRETNVERYRNYDRQRTKSPESRARRMRYQERSRKQDPRRWAARQKAGRAYKRGQITKKPCHFCGTTECLEMHHPDYEQPLRVYWLCRIWHRKLDGMNKSGSKRPHFEEQKNGKNKD